MLVWFSAYDEKEIPKSQVFNLILDMSRVFGERKELRFLGWCGNYKMESYFDGVFILTIILYIEIQIYC